MPRFAKQPVVADMTRPRFVDLDAPPANLPDVVLREPVQNWNRPLILIEEEVEEAELPARPTPNYSRPSRSVPISSLYSSPAPSVPPVASATPQPTASNTQPATPTQKTEAKKTPEPTRSVLGAIFD